MSSLRRVNTLRAIAKSARTRIGSNIFNHVDQELQELAAVARINPEKRKNLLQLLHAIRSLETALKEEFRLVIRWAQSSGNSRASRMDNLGI
ncbi:MULTISPECIES: hypothetical protein [Bradyrhizobium]|uniref:hypothetical protein n=1 Tax=Bradyrhizobium TaxID=374 RepID=UPI00117BECF4|nr:hypothetical protein [Bradyrhizobium japonicum]